MEKLKNKKLLIIMLSIVTFFFLTGAIIMYLICPVDTDEKNVTFKVETGETYSSIADDLKDEHLIKCELLYKVYLKVIKPGNLEAGNYKLSQSMRLKEIVSTLQKGATSERATVNVTFVEGKNMRYVIQKISETFGYTEDQITSLLSDKSYLDELISNHWIITSEVENASLYYSLEGYLFPDTYEFYKDSTIKEIFEKMITNLENKVTPYKEEIIASGRTFHEMLTLSSIIEQEAGTSNDRKGVAGVFYNRLNAGWSLGSDVTTYYAEKVELWSRDLYAAELKECNAYNTRAVCMAGKLPVGPICDPSLDSVIAAIEPTDSDYYYFVADIYGETYFNKTESGHLSTVKRLKSEGKWFQY